MRFDLLMQFANETHKLILSQQNKSDVCVWSEKNLLF